VSAHHDPELDDVLQDDELRRLARLLSAADFAEPPLDEAFRSALRRQLMQQADAINQRRTAGWRRLFAPTGLAWAGAAAGLLLIASTVVYWTQQQPAVVNQIVVGSPIDGSRGVQLQQTILLSFNQPMNQAATQASVQVTPATSVTFSWQDSHTLAIQPVSGNLAPNTQYQVTIGPGATTAANVTLTAPQKITFVTQPQTPPTPTPSPRPSPTPGSLLTGETQLVTFSGGPAGAIAWTPDSSTLYFLGAGGVLDAVSVKDGKVTVIAPDGASSPAVSPAGDRLAYVRGGKIEILTIASGSSSELVVTPPPTAVGWAADGLVWTAGDGVYKQGPKGPAQSAPLPTKGVTVLSIAPDGGHVAYLQDQALTLLDVASGKSVPLGQTGAGFLSWSPDGSQVLLSSPAGVAVSDLAGRVSATLTGGQPSWSTHDAILLGGDTSLSQVRPDGSGTVRLAQGIYDSPAWAPDASTFAFVRAGAIWVASAPPLPSVLDQATAVVNSFMAARLKSQADQASQYLDQNGKQAYAPGGLNLVLGGDSGFTRYYILTQDIVATQPVTIQVVVRLVLSHDKIDVSDFEETLSLVRDSVSGQFVIDQAAGGAHRNLGKGAEVVAVQISRNAVAASFDSDLDPSTVAGGVRLLDSNGKLLEASPAYSNRTVTFAGLDLKFGQKYQLVVSSSVRDVLGHNVASEYGLVFAGPAATGRHDQQGSPPPSPSPSPSPSPAVTSPSPSPAG
jgi:hypothetical protein